jgi:hypothetical protein
VNARSPAEQAWRWLGTELDRWAEAGNRAHFWWRDDDAALADARLQRLAALSTKLRIPLSLAVIPARMQADLVELIYGEPALSVLQHGFAHRNHAAPGQRKLELGGTRPEARIIADLEQGRQCLEQSFGDRFLPVLVPPWNRIDGNILSCLPQIGFAGISATKARRRAFPAPALLQVNTHLDPLNWRRGGGFIGVYPAIAILIQHLVAKRSGYRDEDEPSGILSHHLAHNEAAWQFLEDLLQFLSRHPAVNFVDAVAIWK